MTMKLLANENLSLDAIQFLREVGYDVTWIREDSPGADGPSVLARAVTESRVLITFDKDFGELAFRHGLPATCGIILLRITNCRFKPGSCPENHDCSDESQ